MSKKQTDFLTLSEEVISELKGLGYMDSSLTNYRTRCQRVFAGLGKSIHRRILSL